MWNLRITCPHRETHVIDDDIAAAFRMICCHPSMVSMHAFVIFGRLFFCNRLAFGDTTSPANFEPIADARKQTSQSLCNDPTIVDQLGDLMPKLDIAPEPDLPTVSNEFLVAPPDSQNPGIIDELGNRKPPNFDHHADDNLCCDIRPGVEQAVAASVLGLCKVAGFPDGRQPDPFSRDKFEDLISHRRKCTGKMVDSRTVMISLPDCKRQQLVDHIAPWITTKPHRHTIGEAAEIHGKLSEAAQFCPWARALFFILQNELRNQLKRCCSQLQGCRKRCETNALDYVERNTELPPSVAAKLAHLTGHQEWAAAMWRSKTRTKVSTRLRRELVYIYNYLKDFSNPWEVNIGHIIKRDPLAEVIGDACPHGCGFFCDLYRVVSVIPLSTPLRRRMRLNSKHGEYLHINAVECATTVFEYACGVTIIEDPSCEEMRRALFPNGIPPMPVQRTRIDNTTSAKWLNATSSASLQGQELIKIFAMIRRFSNLENKGLHLAGDLNEIADGWSRPDDPKRRRAPSSEPGYRLSPEALAEHVDMMLEKYPNQKDCKVFVPSSNLLDAIRWGLRPRDAVSHDDGIPPELTRPCGSFMSINDFRCNIQFL